MTAFTDLVLKRLEEKGIRAELGEVKEDISGRWEYDLHFLKRPHTLEDAVWVFAVESEVIAAAKEDWETLPENEAKRIWPASVPVLRVEGKQDSSN